MNQPLDIVQRWMQSVITHPAGVAAGVESDSAQQHLPMAAEDLETVINRSRQQTSEERLAVYANAYYVRLIECLASEFPIFRQAVGEDAFGQFAINYLHHYPSRSYTLGDLSDDFPKFLDETKPPTGDLGRGRESFSSRRSPMANDLSENDSRPLRVQVGWADFLVDLARLEQTLDEVFDGPGIEGKTIVTADALKNIDSARWPDARLKLVPCLRLLEFRFPVNPYYTAAKRGATELSPYLAPQLTWLAITRRDYVVRRYELSHPQFVLLTALERGATVGEAIAAAADASTGSADVLAADLERWFFEWAAAPLFESIAID